MAHETHGAAGAYAHETLAHGPEAQAHGRVHVPGSMDVSDHERTFAAFLRFMIRTTLFILVALVLLALINA
jgi:hypothetical protein